MKFGPLSTYKKISVEANSRNSSIELTDGNIVPANFIIDAQSDETLSIVEIGERRYISLYETKDKLIQLGATYDFTIVDIRIDTINKKFQRVFELKQSDNFYLKKIRMFVGIAEYYNHKNNDHIKCKVVEITPNIIRVEYKFKFTISNTAHPVEFKVVGAPEIEDVELKRPDYGRLLVGDLKGQIFGLLVPGWQKHYINLIKSIRAKVSIDGGKTKLIQSFEGTTHPFFEKGKEYEFEFLNESTTVTGKILVSGPDKVIYQILKPFTLHDKSIQPGTILKLVYAGINPQNGTIKTNYFVAFDEIVKEYRALKRITFDSLRESLSSEDNNDDSLIKKMFVDFDSKENIWIISFCKILSNKIDQFLDSRDFDTALIYIDVLMKFENWILGSGFLNTFSKETQGRLYTAVTNTNGFLISLSKAVETILDEKVDEFLNFWENMSSEKFATTSTQNIFTILFVFKYCSIPNRNYTIRFNNFVTKIGKINGFKGNTEICRITNEIINDSSIYYEKVLFSDIYINIKKRNQLYNDSPTLKEYIQLTYIAALVSFEWDNAENLRFYLLRLSKLQSLYCNNDQDKFTFALTSLFLTDISLTDIYDCISFTYNIWDFDTELIVEQIPLNRSTIAKIPKEQIKVTSADSVEVQEEAEVIGNSSIGYLLKSPSGQAFLPFFNTRNALTHGARILIEKYLRNYYFDRSFAKPVNKNEAFPQLQTIEAGSDVTGIVKRIESFGVFVNLGEIDGLIPATEVSVQYIKSLDSFFKIGEKIVTRVKSYEIKDDILRLTLSRREILLDHQKHSSVQVDQVYEGRITNVDKDFGIFVELYNSHSGLIPKNEICWDDPFMFEKYFSIGEEIRVKCISVIKSKRYFSLKSLVSNIYLSKRNFAKRVTGRIIGYLSFDDWKASYLSSWQTRETYSSQEGILCCPFCHSNSPYLEDIGRRVDEKTLHVSKNSRRWHCTNCNYQEQEKVLLYISDFKVTTTGSLEAIDDNIYQRVRKQIRKSDTVSGMLKVFSNGNIVFEPDTSTFRNENLLKSYEKYSKFFLLEVASSYEQLAFLQLEFEDRIRYLNWAKYYYGAGKSAKSYYLKAYINYISIIRDVVNSADIEKSLLAIKDKTKELIDEIEIETLYVEVFPEMEKIILLLKIINSFGSHDKETLNFLYTNSIESESTENDYIANLSSVILAYNLFTNFIGAHLQSELITNITTFLNKSFNVFYSFETDEEDVSLRLLVDKLIKKGESINIEFKSSLNTPVLSKETKKQIKYLQQSLLSCKEEEAANNIKEKIKQISSISKNDKQIIEEINFAVIKTIAAFANTEGGTLLIGVTEDDLGSPIVEGIEPDYEKLGNFDGIKLKLDQLIQKYFDNSHNNLLIKSIDLVNYKGKDIVVVQINKILKGVFVTEKLEKKFYIRRQGSSIALNSYELYQHMNHLKLNTDDFRTQQPN